MGSQKGFDPWPNVCGSDRLRVLLLAGHLRLHPGAHLRHGSHWTNWPRAGKFNTLTHVLVVSSCSWLFLFFAYFLFVVLCLFELGYLARLIEWTPDAGNCSCRGQPREVNIVVANLPMVDFPFHDSCKLVPQALFAQGAT